jgi:hypothetical protein
VYSYP